MNLHLTKVRIKISARADFYIKIFAKISHFILGNAIFNLAYANFTGTDDYEYFQI